MKDEVMEFYLIAKDHDLNNDEFLSLIYSNPEKLMSEISIEEAFRYALIFILANEMLKLIKRCQ